MGYGMKSPGPWVGVKNFNWYYEGEVQHDNFELALNTWQKELGITFTKTTKVNGTPKCEFTVDVIDTKMRSGKTIWDRLKNVMRLQPEDSLGTCLHEIGHLLGISHEQDRKDKRKEFYNNYATSKAEASMLIYGCEYREGDLQDYGDYDSDSIMQYPEINYIGKQSPSTGDIATAKLINGW